MKSKKPDKGIEIKLYQPFGSSRQAYVFGHVFKKQKLKRERVSGNIFKNAWEMLKRYRVQMLSRQPLVIHAEDKEYILYTNRKGYFFQEIKPVHISKSIHFTVSLKNDSTIKKSGKIEISNPDHIFISDIDDTILVSHSTSLLKKIYTLLSRNHERRKPFEGVRDFYHKLKPGEIEPLFFYVSSSEWNLYDFIKNFCDHNDLPKGIYLLNDIKVGLAQVIKSGGGSHRHKYDKIRLIRDTFSKARLTLIGDSGQRDPEIYEKIALETPDRISGIYIRDLHKSKTKRLKQKIMHLKEHDIEMNLFT